MVAACVFAVPALAPAASSAYAQIALAAMEGDELARVDFARVAMSEMAREHEETLARVRTKSGSKAEDRAKHARWLARMRPFIDDLHLLVEDIDFGAAVDVIVLADSSVQLVIGERSVIVNPLDINRPEFLESRIVDEFCALYYCNFSGAAPGEGLERAYDPGTSAGRWRFAQGAGTTFQTHDGLQFMFSSVQDKSDKERVCLLIARELRLVVEQIRHAADSGYFVDWRYVHVRNEAATREQHVVINKNGDFIPLALPGLGKAQGALATALPWIEGQMRGEALPLSFPRAEVLLRKLLASG